MKNNVILGILCLFCISAYAQNNSPEPKKIKINWEYEDYLRDINPHGYENSPTVSVDPLGEKVKKPRQRAWTFQLSNIEGKEDVNYTVSQKRKTELVDVVTTADAIHALFVLPKKNKLQVLSIDALTGNTKQTTYGLTKHKLLSKSAAINDHILLPLRKRDEIISLDLEEGTLSKIPLDLPLTKKAKILPGGFQHVKGEDGIFLTVNAREGRSKTHSYIAKFDDDLKISKIFDLSKKIPFNLNDISITKNEEGQYMFSGAYNSYESRSLTGGEHLLNVVLIAGSLASGNDAGILGYNESVLEGVFLAQYGEDKLDFLKIHNYTDFESYRARLNEVQLEKLDKMKIAGKVNIDDITVVFHDVISLADGYMLFGEKYSPSFIYGHDYAGGSSRIFNGYDYGNIIVSKFDKEGNLIWDKELENHCYAKPREVVGTLKLDKIDDHTVRIQYQNRLSTPLLINSDGNTAYEQDPDLEEGEMSKSSSMNTEENTPDEIESTIAENNNTFLGQAGVIRPSPERIPENRFFQESGGGGSLALPIVTTFVNIEKVKAFDTYHFGFDVEGFLNSKPFWNKTTKLRLSGGFFIYGDVATILSGSGDPYDNYNYNYYDSSPLIAAGGIEVGAALSFMDDRLIIGSSFPFGGGNSKESYGHWIVGATPSIEYAVHQGINSNIFIKCEFPMWKYSLNSSPGFIMTIGFANKYYRSPKRNKKKKKQQEED